MKRLCIYSIFALMLLSVTAFSATSDDLKNDDLSGNVKKMTITTFIAVEKAGEYVNTDIKYYPFVTAYDKNGNRISGKEYDPAGSVLRTWVYKYDDNGNRLQLKILDNNDNATQVINYKYDDGGNLIEKINININKINSNTDDITKERWVYKYDEAGNKIEEIYYDGSDNVVKRFVNKYDDKGNKIETVSFKKDGSIFNTTEMKYDSRGNLIEMVSYDSDYKPTWKETYKNDDKGNMIEKAAYAGGNKLLWKMEMNYNNHGELSNKVIEGYSKADSTNIHSQIHKISEENKTGDEINKINIKKSITGTNYIYVYDDNGNWIKKIMKSGDADIMITERTIEYYGK